LILRLNVGVGVDVDVDIGVETVDWILEVCFDAFWVFSGCDLSICMF
jgi:hypothetical protein